MIFSKPVPFREAAESREVRAILPTSLSSEQLSELEQEIIERALFSARTASAEYLQTIDDVLAEFADGKIDLATARLQLRDKLRELGYAPDSDTADTITDFASDERLNLILRTNADIAAGYGDWMQGQAEPILFQWPAQELYRAYPRKLPRSGKNAWPNRFQMAGGEEKKGHMVAMKNSYVWKQLGSRKLFSDGLGNPFPPFAFNSGMDVRDIDRAKAIELGVMNDDTPAPEPESRGFNEDLKVDAAVRSTALRRVIESAGYKFDGDVLAMSPN